MRRLKQILLAAVWFVTSPGSIHADPPAAPDFTFFESKIRPVLADKCFQCHSVRANKAKGGLRLDSREALFKGGDTGPAVVPGEPSQSLLLTAIRRIQEDLEMPPKEPLSAEVIEDFEQWIKTGVPFPDRLAPSETDTKSWWETISEQTLLPTMRPLPEVVDYYVAAKLTQADVKPAAPAEDHVLIRRLTLDLAGRIPTAAEMQGYVESTAPDERTRAVDRLLASPGFARHFVHELDWLLMSGAGNGLRSYLARAVEKNRPWDGIFRDLILAKDKETDAQGSSAFLRARYTDQDRMTTDVSVRFFGVNISCAQCHDHPLVPSWKQDHYYGMKSFFGRTFDFGDYVAEREYGVVSFKTTKGESKQAPLTFLTGGVWEEPSVPDLSEEQKKAEKQLAEELKKKKEQWPEPKFSRRAQLIEAALRPGADGFFARAIVNRVWNQVFGRGLVTPLDQLHGVNLPSHPELLVWLARDLVAHGYDLRRLLRGLVLSDAYARASRWPGGDRPDPALFAVALPRALTPQQYALSLQLATADQENLRCTEDIDKQLKPMEEASQSWLGHFGRSEDNFQVSVDEALLLSNNERVYRELLADSSGRLVNRLAALAHLEEAIQTAFACVLSRPAEDQEMKAVKAYLARRVDRPTEAWRQVVWSLLTGSEFRFNH